jgi:hypothetical protein
VIPALPPRRRRIRALALSVLAAGAVAGGLGYLVAVWPAPEPFVVPRDRTPVAILPMTNGATYVTGIDDGEHCLALLDDWVRRPNWTLTLDTGVSACMGDDERESLTVDSAGDAAWSRNGLPAVPLHLTPTQLASLHAAAPLTCVVPEEERGGFASYYVDVKWGGDQSLARRVHESPAQAQIQSFIDDAAMQYRYRRLAESADFHATVMLDAYTIIAIDRRMSITFDARGALTIRLRKHTIKAQSLDIETLVDAMDWVESGETSLRRPPPGLVAAIDHATFDAGLQN